MTSDKIQLAAEIIDAEISDLMQRIDALQRARDILLGAAPEPVIEATSAVQLPTNASPACNGTQPPAETKGGGYVDLQDRALEFLTEHHGTRVTNATIARALDILPASVTQILNALEADGSIRREGSTHLRRIFVTAIEDADEEGGEAGGAGTPAPTAEVVEPAPATPARPRDPLAPPPLPSEAGAGR